MFVQPPTPASQYSEPPAKLVEEDASNINNRVLKVAASAFKDLGGIDESRAPKTIRSLNLATDANAVARAGISTAGTGMQAAGAAGVTVAAFAAAIGGLQLIQGITLIGLGMKLLPVSYQELSAASKTQSNDPERYSVALRNFINHLSLVILGVLFIGLGSVAVTAFIGAKVGLSALALGGLVIGAAVIGGVLSAVCVVRGIHLICRSEYNLRYINDFESQLFEKIKAEDWDGAIALAKLSGEDKDELYCERRVGRKTKDELVKYLSLLKDTDEKTAENLFGLCFQGVILRRESGVAAIKKEWVRILAEGLYEKKLEQKMLRKIGALMFVAGLLGVISSAATKGVGAAALVAVSATLAANALFTVMEAGWIGVDEPVVFEKIQKQMKKYDPALPQDLSKKLTQDDSLEKLFIEATHCTKDNIKKLFKESLEGALEPKIECLLECDQIIWNLKVYNPMLLDFLNRQKNHFSEDMQCILETSGKLKNLEPVFAE